MRMAKREDDLSDYGTPESFKRSAKVFVLRDAKSGHAVNAKSLSYLERLERDGVIETRMKDAGEQFGYHFQRAGLERYQTINLFRVLGGMGDEAEAWIHHRSQIRKACESLGGLQASIIWHVCGNEKPLAEWVRDRQASGFRLNEHHAKGMLIGSLDSLAKFFGK